MDQNTDLEEYKTVVLGPSDVGKTALTFRLISGKFIGVYDPTIEDSYRKELTVDEKKALLDILDTAGQEEFQGMHDLWVREAKGFLLVYSIASKQSFDQAKDVFDKILSVHEEHLDRIALVLIGNKCDLEDKRQVTKAEGENLAQEWKKDGVSISFFETSALAELNNVECFLEVVRLLRVIKKKYPKGNATPEEGNCPCSIL